MIVKSLEDARLAARMAKDLPLIAFVSLVLSEVTNIGKNDGNRATSDNEAIALFKKMVARNEDTIKYVTDEESRLKLSKENAFLSQFLPQMVDEDSLQQFITAFVKESGTVNIGMIMGAVKSKYGQSADMKAASKMARAVIDST